MITVIAIGAGTLVVMAIVIGILDAAQASAWRDVAAQRRELWDERQSARSVPTSSGHGEQT